MSEDGRHDLGRCGEQLACDHLLRQGFEILERNYRTRWGELDIVAFDGRALVFCEVKTRRRPCRGGQPLEAVHAKKQARLRKMAGRWLIERSERPSADAIRFDAIGVSFDTRGQLLALEHIEQAF